MLSKRVINFFLCNNEWANNKKPFLYKVLQKKIFNDIDPYVYVLTKPLVIAGHINGFEANSIKTFSNFSQLDDLSLEDFEKYIKKFYKPHNKFQIYLTQDEAVNDCVSQQVCYLNNKKYCLESPFILKINAYQLELTYENLFKYEEILVPKNCENSIQLLKKSKKIELFDIGKLTNENKLR